MSKLTVSLALLAVCGLARGAEETTTVEIYCASEHVPEGLKEGARVNLMMVVGKTATPAGKVSYSTKPVVKDIEVASVKQVDKPKEPDQAVKVELKVTTDQAAAIEKVKAQLVTTVTTADGTTKSEKKPIPLRLEPTK